MPEKDKPKFAAPSIDQIAQDVRNNNFDPVFGEAGKGASFDFAGKDIDRYISYGTETYNKLGYDPFRDNSSFYNRNTDASADLQRAFTGVWKLAGVGFKDTFGFGAMASKDAHKEFDEVMSTYGSTREGTAGFISNTMLSSGYTVGIITAIALEEAMLAGATALTGGLGSVATVGETASVGKRGYDLLSKSRNFVKGFDKVSDAVTFSKSIKNARGIWGKTARGVKGFAGKLAPLNNTFDFIRNSDKLADLNGLQKTLQGIGSIARDARKIHMTNAESKLEANLARDEFKEELINEWNSDPSHVGMTMDKETLDGFNSRATEVYKNTYQGNLALIYATNALTFDSMFKSGRFTNKMFNIHNSGKFTVKTGVKGKVVINALENTFKNNLKKKISSLTWRGTAKKTLGNSVEGFQEVGQDLISGVAKRYSSDNTAFKGSFYDSFYDSLGDMRMESFLSGMVMGTFASPVSMSIEAFNKFTVGGGYQAVTDSKGYAKAKENSYKDAKKKAEQLTEFFNNSGTFSEFASKNVFEQSISADGMLEAAEDDNRKHFEDKRAETFRQGLHTLVETGMESELEEYLDDLGNYTNEELNQAMGRTDITDSNRAKVMDKVSAYKTKITNFKERYERIENDHVNPISIRSIKSDDPEAFEKQLLYRAHENFKKELLFSEDRIEEMSKRTSELHTALVSEGVTSNDITSILTADSISQEIEALKLEVSTDKEYSLDNDASKKRSLKLEALKKLKTSIVAYNKLGTSVTGAEENYDVMFEAYNEYVNVLKGDKNTSGNRVMNKRDFVKYWDYLNMKGESDQLQEFVNTMNDPMYAIQHVKRLKEQLKTQDGNKKELIEQSLKKFYAKKTADNIFEKLLDSDFIFDQNEIDDLIKNGIMPKKFFNINTNKELTGEDLKVAQDIVSKQYEQLTGKTITASERGYATVKKGESDTRTLKDLVEEYGKLEKPIDLFTFIKSLLRSKNVGNTEKTVIKQLLLITNLKDKKVILTDNGDTSIDLNEDGDIVIDLRFASSDYTNGDISFEYLGTAAVLRTFFTDQLSNNPELKKQVAYMMDDAKEALIGDESRDVTRKEANNIPVFNDPVLFLAEAMGNSAFQKYIKDIDSTSTSKEINLWDSLRENVSEKLGEVFEGGLLSRAIDLAYLTIQDDVKVEKKTEVAEEEEVTETPEQETTAETKEVTVEAEQEAGELTPVEVSTNKISEVTQQLESLKKERSNTKKIKFRTYNSLSRKIEVLDLELADLLQELADNKERESIELSKPIEPDHDINEPIIDTVDENGEQIIYGATGFVNLPDDLKIVIAEIYLTNDKDYGTTSSTDGVTDEGSSKPNMEFDAGETVIDPMLKVNELTAEDFLKIDGHMQNNIRYIEAMAAYVLERKKNIAAEKSGVSIEDIEEAEEVVEQTEPQTINLDVSYLESAFPGISKVLSGRKLKNRIDKLNSQTTQEGVLKIISSIKKEFSRITAKTEKIEEERKQNFRDNNAALKVYMEYNDTAFVLSKDDQKLFLQLNPLIRFESTEVFTQKAFEYYNDAKGIGSTYRKAIPTLDVNSSKDIEERVESFKKNKTLSSKIIAGFNASLLRENSKFTIVKKTKNGDIYYVVEERKGKKKKPKSKSQQENDDLGDWYSVDDLWITNDNQAKFLVYEFLRKNKVHPSAIPTREPRSYTSNKSKYKSFDGIADALFGDVSNPKYEEDGRNIVEEVLLNFKTISELKKYLLDEMRIEKSQENSEFDDAFNDELLEELERKDMEAERLNKEQEEFEKSDTYKIITGSFIGPTTFLSKADKLLYEELNNLKKDENVKSVEENESILFDKLKGELLDKTNYVYIQNATILLKSENLALIDILTLSKAINSRNSFTKAQVSFINKLIKTQLQNPKYENKVVMYDGGIVRIVSSNSNEIILQSVSTDEIYKPTVDVFLEKVTEVIATNTEHDPSGIDNKVTDENSNDLSDVFSEIFDNFTGSMTEFESMDAKELNASIETELNKCK